MEYARSVAKHVGAAVHEVAPSYPEYEWFNAWAEKHAEVPPYPNGIMSLGLHQLARSRGARVVLTGLGGDEWLGGSFEYYGEELRAGRWGELWRCVQRDLADSGIWSRFYRTFRQAVKRLLPGRALELRRRWLARKDATPGGEILTTAMRARLEGRRSQPAPAPMKRAKLALLRDPFNLGAGEWSERELAALGLEIRHPYRTRQVVEFGFSVPERMLARGSWNRWLHRESLRGLLPENVRQRHSKAEFSVTYERALSGLRARIEALAGDGLAGRLEADWIRVMYRNAAGGDCCGILPGGFQIWGVFGCALLIKAESSRGGEADPAGEAKPEVERTLAET